MKTVTFITACWKRPEILAVYEQAMHRFIQQSKYKCFTAYVISPNEDNDWLKIAETVSRDYSYQYYFSNSPLSHKWNFLLEKAMDEIDSDYYVIMGSDDIHSLDAWKHYELIIDNEYDYGGHNSLIFHDVISGEAVKYKSEVKIAGCGTILSKRLVKECFPLWPDNTDKGLDVPRDRKIHSFGYKLFVFNDAYCLIDLKSDTNINGFERFKRKQHITLMNNYRKPNQTLIENLIPELEFKMINELKRTKRKNLNRD